jgi:hypothetical protein
MESYFDIYPASQITSFGVPYDIHSVMHVDAYAFSKNGLKTIEPKVSKLSINFLINLRVRRQNLWFFIKTLDFTEHKII